MRLAGEFETEGEAPALLLAPLESLDRSRGVLCFKKIVDRDELKTNVSQPDQVSLTVARPGKDDCPLPDARHDAPDALVDEFTAPWLKWQRLGDAPGPRIPLRQRTSVGMN